ncbi:two-component system response regulator [Candidatus Omnitrophota bacterium]
MKKKILIVDDDKNFTSSIVNLLGSNGYDVITAQSGVLGYARAKEHAPDLILLDVMMATKGEGFEISRSLRRDPKTKSIPVIIVTGVREEMGMIFRFDPDGVWLPVKEVLEKPVKPETLLAVIKKNIA